MFCKNLHCTNTINNGVLCQSCIDNAFEQPYNFINQQLINQIETSYNLVEQKTIKQVYHQTSFFEIDGFDNSQFLK